MMHRSVQLRLLLSVGCFLFGGAAGAICARLCADETLLAFRTSVLSFAGQSGLALSLLWSLFLPGLFAFFAGSLGGVLILPILDAGFAFFAAVLFSACLSTGVPSDVLLPALAFFLAVPCLMRLSADGIGMSRCLFRCLLNGGKRSFDARPFLLSFFSAGLFLCLLTFVFLLLLKRMS